MIGVLGVGNVGSAIYQSFKKYYEVVGYDKHKESDSFEALLECDYIFVCLPTPTHSGMYLNTGLGSGQNIQAIYTALAELRSKGYRGTIIIKSTVLPGTCRKLQKEHPQMTVLHSPEFLSQGTALKDLQNMKKVIIGGENELEARKVADLYARLGAKTAYIVKWTESESIKYIHNVFLACKIAVFNELYDALAERKTNFQLCADLACEITGWINPRHVQVPGPDGMFGYGGDCFPKDIKAFLVKYHNLDLDVIKAAITSNFNRRRGGSKAPKPPRDAYIKVDLNVPRTPRVKARKVANG